jgi:SAM-dependent methyltransferase
MKNIIVESIEKPQYFGRDLEAMSFATNYHNWIADEFKPYLGNNVAEIGAGTGNFSKLLIESTKKIVAFEPSENMFPQLQEQLREYKSITKINNYFVDEYLKYKEHFDSVVYVNVLEHIEGDEKELSCAYSGLKKGGHILIFAPALSYLYSDFDRKVGHYRRYHKKDLITLANQVGFNIVDVKYLDFVGILPWYIVFVLLRKTLTKDNVSLYDNLVVPIVRKIESIITPPIGKNILLIAQK